MVNNGNKKNTQKKRDRSTNGGDAKQETNARAPRRNRAKGRGNAMEATNQVVAVHLLIDRELLTRVEDYRFAHRIASRLEAIRELLQKGLGMKGKKCLRAL